MSLNEIESVSRAGDPFGNKTDECEYVDGNIRTRNFHEIVVADVQSNKEFDKALKAGSAERGRIAIVVTDRNGEKFNVTVKTSLGW